jgi:hypothetical protein
MPLGGGLVLYYPAVVKPIYHPDVVVGQNEHNHPKTTRYKH